jgi:hypothetical protein
VQKISIKHLVLGTVALNALVLGGCLNDSGTKGSQDGSLSISLAVPNVSGSKTLQKGSTITLQKLIVTLTSSVGTDAVIRDTITPGENGFSSVSTENQTVAKSYPVKPLRGWTLTVKTLDANDSVIHFASKLADSIKVGEARLVEINLTSKFIMYMAKFTLPDSIGSATGTIKQRLYINRFMLVLDGDTVRDTTAGGPGVYFASKPVSHLVGFDYVRADTTHVLKLYVFGDMENWDPLRPLYGDSVTIIPSDTLKKPTLAYTGPGSSSDTGGVGASIDPLVIEIGKVGVFNIEPEFPENPLPKKLFRNKQ